MGKFIDLAGEKFGRWTVLERDFNPIQKTKGTYWKCQCECGTIKTVYGPNLKNGISKSCGCLAKELSGKRNSKDLTNKKFGFLTVLKDTGERQNGAIMWECQCECGKKVIVRSSHLLSGDVKSCKQCSKIDFSLIGKVFGFLTIKEYDFEKRKWKCKCQCGNYCFSTTDSLKSNKTKSCGCLKSYGESLISKILTDNNIPYEKEKFFDNCKFLDSNCYARFDFYVNNKYIIEYDGEQHFKIGTGIYNNKEKFKKTKEHDEYKNQWCKENNIPLIRIPYTHLEELCLEDLLLETSKFVINRN